MKPSRLGLLLLHNAAPARPGQRSVLFIVCLLSEISTYPMDSHPFGLFCPRKQTQRLSEPSVLAGWRNLKARILRHRPAIGVNGLHFTMQHYYESPFSRIHVGTVEMYR